MRLTPDDHRTQVAVLMTVLHHAPHLLTEAELVAEVTDASDDFAIRDDAQRAVRDLTASGVLQRLGCGFVQTSLAARRVSGLLERS